MIGIVVDTDTVEERMAVGKEKVVRNDMQMNQMKKVAMRREDVESHLIVVTDGDSTD